MKVGNVNSGWSSQSCVQVQLGGPDHGGIGREEGVKQTAQLP